MMQPLVAIVILNWNGYSDTLEAIQSVNKITYSNFKIILIDNGSDNDEYNKLKTFFGHDDTVELIGSSINTGFAGGVNIGIRRSLDLGADYTLLLNNDVKVNKDFLTKLVDSINRKSEIGIVGSKIYYYDNPNTVWAGGYKVTYLFPPFTKKIHGPIEMEVNEVLGCSMLIKNKVFMNIGLFDDEYFAYGEETDFNYRAIKAGYKIMYCPGSIVWHKVSASTGGGFSPLVAYLKVKNKIKFGMKNLPKYYWPSYFFYVLLFVSYWIIKSIRHKEFARVAAILKGIRG